MARGPRQIIQGAVVLDSQGLSLLIDEDERMVKRLQKARAESFHVVISALTIVETSAAARRRQRRDFVLSRLRIEPVTRDLTLLASELLHRETMSGHKHAIGAVVAATALQQVRPTLLYTSDPDDLTALCAEPERPKDARVIIVRVLCRRFAKVSLLCKLEPKWRLLLSLAGLPKAGCCSRPPDPGRSPPTGRQRGEGAPGGPGRNHLHLPKSGSRDPFFTSDPKSAARGAEFTGC